MNRKSLKFFAALLLFVMFFNNGMALAETIGKEDPGTVDPGKDKKSISIVSKLLDNTDLPDNLQKKFKKDYITAVQEDTVGIKDFLEFDEKPKIKLEIESGEDYNYSLDKIGIGDIEVSREDYDSNKTFKELNLDGGIVSSIDKIEVFYKAKPKIGSVKVILDFEDELHGDKLSISKNISVAYTGGSMDNVEVTGDLEGGKREGEKLKVTIKDKTTEEKTIILEHEGYSFKNLEGPTEVVDGKTKTITYKALGKPKEIVKSEEYYNLGRLKFSNEKNNESFLVDLKQKEGFTTHLFESRDKTEVPLRTDDISEIVTSNICNRKDGVTGYEASKYYYNDKLNIAIKAEKEKEFVGRATKVFSGNERYSFDRDIEIKPIVLTLNSIKNESQNTSVVGNLNFDYKRLDYMVKVDDGEIQTFDIVEEDAGYVIFGGENIASVKVGEVEYKDKKIKLKDIKDKVIEVKTVDEVGLETIDYTVSSVDFDTKGKIYESRKFKGLAGMKLGVNSIKQHNYNGKKVVLKGDYRLADREQKEIVLAKDLDIKFYFTKSDKIRYKALYISKYEEGAELKEGEYLIERPKGDETEVDDDSTLVVLGETENYIDNPGKPINIEARDYRKGGYELIKLEAPIDSKWEIEGYEGYKVKYVSDKVTELAEEDTVYVYSYKRLVDKPSEKVKFQLKETFIDGGQFGETINIEYPRYKNDYTVDFEVPMGRLSCKIGRDIKINNEIVITIPDSDKDKVEFKDKEISEGAELKSIEGLKNQNGILKLTVLIKGREGEKTGDDFPKKKDSIMGRMSKLFVDEKSSTEEVFKGIEIVYGKSDNNQCSPSDPLKEVTIETIKSYRDKEGNIVPINSDNNKEVIKTLGGSKVKLDFVKLEAGKDPVYMESVTKDKDNKNYKYIPFDKEGKFIGIVDGDGKEIIEDGKILGQKIDDIKARDEKIYVIYEEQELPVIDPVKREFETEYYAIEMPKDIYPKYGEVLNEKNNDALKKHYDLVKEDIVEYYSSKEDIVKDIVDLLEEYSKVETDEAAFKKKLGEFKTSLNKDYKYSEDVFKKIDELLAKEWEKPAEDSKGKKDIDSIESAIKKLNKTLVSFLKEDKKHTLVSMSSSNKVVREGDHIVSWYDKSLARKANYSSLVTSDKVGYNRLDKVQYSLLPVSISNNFIEIEKEGKLKDFSLLNDDIDGFNLAKSSPTSSENWGELPTGDVKIGKGQELGDRIPVIFLARGYSVYEKEIKPEPDKDKNLTIYIRFFDKGGNKQKEYLIEYKKLPNYIRRLGWKIADYREYGYEYTEEYSKDGLDLTEGNTKFSEELVKGEDKKLCVDYKGSGTIPPEPKGKYPYTIHNFKVDLNDLIGIGSYKSEKYLVGTKLDIAPDFLEDSGLGLLDSQYKFTDNYSPREITIRDEEKEGKDANVYKFYYGEKEGIKDKYVYNVRYVDSSYRDLASNRLNRVSKDTKFVAENAKAIGGYKARVGSLELELEKIKDKDLFVEFVAKLNYRIEKEGNKLVMYNSNRVKVAEIEAKDDFNTVYFFYDRDDSVTPDPDPDPIKPVTPEKPDPEEKLNKKDHMEYIQGYPDKTVRPEDNITREEVAAVFYRLLDPKYKASIYTEKNDFKDLKKKRWSNRHISTLANGDILEGYKDGEFKHSKHITRAEVAAIASRFDDLEKIDTSFKDVKGHWAEEYVGSAVKKGWIKGYPDGSFKPDQNITRAEFVTLVNSVLERKVSKENILDGIIKFPDLKEGKWYYLEMVEAINGHLYEKDSNGQNEKWTRLKKFNFDM